MDGRQTFEGFGGRPVRCREFLEGHSDFLDGRLSETETVRFERHTAACASCASYDRTVRSGLGLLKTLPEVEPSEDFLPRLQHRIFHLEDARAAGTASSGRLPALLAVVVVAAVAASPLLRSATTDPASDGAALQETPTASPTTPGDAYSPRVRQTGTAALRSASSSMPLPTAPRLASPGTAALMPVDGGEYLRLRAIESLDYYPEGPYSPLVYGPPRFADGLGAPRLAGGWTTVSASLD